MTDPFAHHPDLRARIKPYAQSFFRDFSSDKMRGVLEQHGITGFPFYTDDHRESLRADALTHHKTGDLWVFAYGSLMWDPALDFAEVRRAFAPEHERRFILRDIYGGRGTAEAPGLMAALDVGGGCEGLAFRIPQARIDCETDILFRREMIAPGYHAVFIPIMIDDARHRALTFIADHDTDLIAGDITEAEQILCLTTGKGVLGTSYDYLKNVIVHLHDMGIPDAQLDALMAKVDATLMET
ncbi:MAG: gamma-glutamylcyclotransferase [Pseudomonadota bacterium]